MEAERNKGVLRLVRSPMEIGSPLVHVRRWEYNLRKGKGENGYDSLQACRT